MLKRRLTRRLTWQLLHACAQAVQAAQVTVEDYAMNHVGLAPLQVVGYEGLLGSIALFGILMPIVYFIPGKDGEGLHEDSLESIHMVSFSRCIPHSMLACVSMLSQALFS
jgi:hypothetical protein